MKNKQNKFIKKGDQMFDISKLDDDQDELATPAEEGEHSVSGSAPSTTSDDDVSDMVEDVIGNKPKPGKPFSIAEEVEKDERAMHDIPPDEADVDED